MYAPLDGDGTQERTDEELVVRVQRGDVEARTRLVQRHAEPLFRYCLTLTDRREDAEDICQETLARAIQRVDGLQAGGAYRGWLFRIARNLATDSYRGARRTCPLPETECAPALVDDNDPQGRVEIGEERATVTRALARLAARHRQVLLLREVQGLSYAEIARRLEVSQSAVETLLFRARRRLREEYRRSAALPAVSLTGQLQAVLARLLPLSGLPLVKGAAITALVVGGTAIASPRMIPALRPAVSPATPRAAPPTKPAGLGVRQQPGSQAKPIDLASSRPAVRVTAIVAPARAPIAGPAAVLASRPLPAAWRPRRRAARTGIAVPAGQRNGTTGIPASRATPDAVSGVTSPPAVTSTAALTPTTAATTTVAGASEIGPTPTALVPSAHPARGLARAGRASRARPHSPRASRREAPRRDAISGARGWRRPSIAPAATAVSTNGARDTHHGPVTGTVAVVPRRSSRASDRGDTIGQRPAPGSRHPTPPPPATPMATGDTATGTTPVATVPAVVAPLGGATADTAAGGRHGRGNGPPAGGGSAASVTATPERPDKGPKGTP